MKSATWLVRIAASTVLSTVGWYVGQPISMFTAYMLSTIAGGYGLYIGGKIARQLF